MIRTRMLLAFAAMTLLLAQAPVQAGGLVMSIEDLTGPTGGAGTFEVLLTSTEAAGGQSFDVAAFSFQLTVPTTAGVQFTAGSTDTVAAPYLFDGTGTATSDPTFTLANVTPPYTTVTGSDTEWTYSSIAVVPGAVFSLGLISYSVGPRRPAETCRSASSPLGPRCRTPQAALLSSTSPPTTVPESSTSRGVRFRSPALWCWSRAPSA